MALDNITTLAGKFASHLELQSYCDAQFITLKKANERIQELEAELEHVKGLLAATQPLLGKQTEILVKSTEQAICEMQIERLRETAMQRALTLEETKRLDLLVKNLLLAKGQVKDVTPDYRKMPYGVSEAQLVEIASIAEPSVEES